MNNKEWQRRVAYEVLIILLMLGLLLFVCRLWPVLLLVILGIFVAAIRLLFLSSKQVVVVEPQPLPPEPPREPTEKDVLSIAYAVILKRVTELIQVEFPEARWVWEAPNAKEQIQKGCDVYILLNHAGGYRRARVVLVNLQITGLEYQTADSVMEKAEQEVSETGNETDIDDDLKEDTPEPVPENYELLAFEWVEANMMDLNSRCNEAIGLGQDELTIYADELPVRESWPDICRELMRNELEEVSCVQDGIQINFKQ